MTSNTFGSFLTYINGQMILALGIRHFITLLGSGLIKINDVSANFNNPRPSLILNN